MREKKETWINDQSQRWRREEEGGGEEGVGRGERSQYLFDWNIVQVTVEQNGIVESISILFPRGES